jgi:diketogulonate reductase-like aldo/keto reductase
MRKRSFGSTGVEVAIVGEGTWQMERDREDDVVAAIRASVDLGIDHVDTAELYGSGRVETMVGRALDGIRDRVFLVSKVLPTNASRDGTIAACERSLARLRTDRLDLYLLHWPGQHPLADTVAAFQELVRAGKILAWGVSNFDVDDLDALAEIVDEREIACNQVLYHLEERAIEHRVLPWCRARGIATVAYSPLGSGSFVAPASPRGRVLADVAAKHDSTPAAVALAWLAREPDVFVIPKATGLAHVRATAAAGDLGLDDDDVGAIDRAFPRGRARGLPTI